MTVRPGVFVIHTALTCALALLLCRYALTPEPLQIDVDMMVSAGTKAEVFVNDLTRPPVTRPVVPGERRRYTFAGLAGDITLLRLDPTDEAGATVEIFSLVVSEAGRRLAEFGPAALAGWTASGIARAGFDAGGLRVRTTDADPILTTRTLIAAGPRGWWSRWLPMVHAPDVAWWLVAGTLGLCLIAAAFDPARRWHLPAALAAVALTAGVLALVSQLPDAPGAAEVAVSRATFFGRSMRPALLASGLILVGAAAVGAAAGRIRRRSGAAGSETAEVARRPMGRAGIVVGLALIAVLCAPGLEGVAAATATRVFTPHWDADNLTYWSYLVHGGGLPYRTFWYPYGGLFTFELPLPVGPALRWLYTTALFGTFLVALGRWRGTGPASAAAAVVLACTSFGLLPGHERYLLGVNVLLSYVAIGRGAGDRVARIAFWGACALALFAEPPQLLYAGVPVVFIAAADALAGIRRDPGGWRTPARRLGLDLGVPVLVAGAGAGLLAGTGQLGGAWTFYARLSDSVAYSAWPTPLPTLRWLVQDQHQSILLAAAAALIAVGTCAWAREGGSRYGAAVAGIGVLVIATMQKTFVRWMDAQMLMPVVAGCLVLALGWPGRRHGVDHAVRGLLLGALGATLLARPDAAAVLTRVSGSAGRALSDAGVVLAGTRADAMRRANALRFAPERFAAYPAERAAVERLRGHAGAGGDVRLFALTDSPVLYVLTGQAVWMANLYNASPIYEQARLVRWLRDEDPPYAVLNRDRLGWDGFSLAVRAPLVYAEAVERYVPFDSVGRVDLLRRRRAGEAPALPYWREVLGADVNVGRLASVSSFDGAARCEIACADLLDVRVRGGADGWVRLPVRVAEVPFSITFARVRGESDYRVLLDRVWFWRLAQRTNLPRALGDPAREDVAGQIRRTPADEGRLY